MSSARIANLSSEHPDIAVLKNAAAALHRAALVVAPTETRYGLLARADSRVALENLYLAKNRPDSMPTAVFVRSRAQIDRFSMITPLADRLISRFLPGPLTLVLLARGEWEPQVVMNKRIGFRWSPSPVIRDLLSLVEFPITATSANLTGTPDCDSIQEIAAAFGDKVELYLDVGPLKGITSTVVDCSGGELRILREGAISRELLVESVKDLAENE